MKPDFEELLDDLIRAYATWDVTHTHYDHCRPDEIEKLQKEYYRLREEFINHFKSEE